MKISRLRGGGVWRLTVVFRSHDRQGVVLSRNKDHSLTVVALEDHNFESHPGGERRLFQKSG